MHTQENIKKTLQFVIVFLGVFFLAALFLYAIDFVPEAPKIAAAEGLNSNVSAAANPAVNAEAPVRIRIAAAAIDTSIENPNSTDVAVLDAALLKGAARYPESALLGENATMYLFGHQSHLPVVHNKAFKAFNDLQTVQVGDEIVVSSAANDYHYRVASVEKVDAETALVDLEQGSKKLVLTTCDSFGKKTDRYVVKADFVSETPSLSAAANSQFNIN
jgi:LPXTG-site transpeptidase (sortase) family protein